MIGGGIFSVLGVATEIAGNAIYISFMIAGIVALLALALKISPTKSFSKDTKLWEGRSQRLESADPPLPL